MSRTSLDPRCLTQQCRMARAPRRTVTLDGVGRNSGSKVPGPTRSPLASPENRSTCQNTSAWSSRRLTCFSLYMVSIYRFLVSSSSHTSVNGMLLNKYFIPLPSSLSLVFSFYFVDGCLGVRQRVFLCLCICSCVCLSLNLSTRAFTDC